MNRFQLSCIDTQSLLILKEDIKAELAIRRKNIGVGKRRDFLKSLKPQEFDSAEEIERYNSSACLRPPSSKTMAGTLPRYMPALLAQDWSSVYPPSSDGGDFYVYAHIDPRSSCFVATNKGLGGNWGGTPFYIGKGSGLRAYDLKRNQAHGKRIASIRSHGFDDTDIVKIIASGLSESEAFCLEAKLIFFFRTEYESPPGPLLNLDTPKTPQCAGNMVRYPSREHWKKRWAADQKKNGGEA